MTKSVKTGLSSCLLSEKARDDGGDQLERELTDALEPTVEWVPVCPEAEMGLGVPREPKKNLGGIYRFRQIPGLKKCLCFWMSFQNR